MLKRKAYKSLLNWKNNSSKKVLLVTGARQVGKTYLIRKFGIAEYKHYIEINFIEDMDAHEAFADIRNTEDFMMKLSLFANDNLVEHETLIFFDEVQENPDVVTAIKFLSQSKDFDYIISGSLLGTELNDIRSWPVGYLSILKMYPLDFEEFCWANNVSEDLIKDTLLPHFESHTEIDNAIHNKFSSLFHRFLICGGMPDAVKTFLDSNDIQQTRKIQTDIISLYRHDISKYAREKSRVVKLIFDEIPAELNKKNKRFAANSIEGNSRFSRYENEFIWIVDAGVALPAYSVAEPRYPLLLSKEHRKFKLYLSDVGLLTSMCSLNVVRDIVNNRPDINYGSIYENVIAQELCAHGFALYYFANRRIGELDFVIQTPDENVVPFEVKSGKSYKRHNALNNALKTENYGIKKAVVLYEGNIVETEKITYMPAYMIMFFQNHEQGNQN